jgi:hypothetical protein
VVVRTLAASGWLPCSTSASLTSIRAENASGCSPALLTMWSVPLQEFFGPLTSAVIEAAACRIAQCDSVVSSAACVGSDGNKTKSLDLSLTTRGSFDIAMVAYGSALEHCTISWPSLLLILQTSASCSIRLAKTS